MRVALIGAIGVLISLAGHASAQAPPALVIDAPAELSSSRRRLESFDRAWWRAYARTLAERFEQDEMHIRALEVVVI